METKDTNFSQFRLRVNIKCSIQAAYDMWATPSGLESWFLRKASFADAKGNARRKKDQIQSGDAYDFKWYGYPDEVGEKGTVISANGKDNFSFTFSLKCPVDIKMYSEQGETIVELFESKLPTDTATVAKHFVGDSRGWIFYLTNLKSVLEGGLDLRNKREELTNVITA